MSIQYTDDRKAYIDPRTGLEIALPPTGSVFPTGFFRTLVAYIRYRFFGWDPVPPVHPDLVRQRRP